MNQILDDILTHLDKTATIIADLEQFVRNAGIHKKGQGQYFTTSTTLQKYVFDCVKYKDSELLEPSVGAGHLLLPFLAHNQNYPIDCYELDPSIKPIVCLGSAQKHTIADFMMQPFTKKYKTIIGNPPYVKQKTGNLYIQFIEKCYDLLAHHGELIFIVPSDFIKATRSSSIINKMCENGSFTDFLFPHDESLFIGAAVDIMVFRYEKDHKQDTAIVNGMSKVVNNNNGVLTFSDKIIEGTPVETLFDVYVGLVSGRDEIYKVPFGNFVLQTDLQKSESFIYAEKFPTGSAAIDAHLLAHKEELLGRKIRTFNESNWWEWGAPRNLRAMKAAYGKPCIYVRNMMRTGSVAAVDSVKYFGGGLLCLIPKAEMSSDQLRKITTYFNNDIEFMAQYTYAGRFKIGQKQLCSAVLPTAILS